MKKIIAMLLALLMISTAVITVSANTTTPDAPVVRGVQTKVDGAVSVRFLSTVHSTDGDAVGYVIKATFLDGNTEVQSFTYSKAEGDDAMESSTIYASVMQNNTPISAVELAEGDESAKGIFAAVISGIPATEDVLFEVVSYVRVGDTYNYSKPTYEKLSNGEMRQLTSGYEEDFSNDIVPLKGGSVAPTISGGKLNIEPQGWGNAFSQLVGRDALTVKPDKVMVEMDIELTTVGVLAFYIGAQKDDPYSSNGAILVTFRLSTNNGANFTNNDTATAVNGSTNALYMAAGCVKVSDGKTNTGLAKEKVLDLDANATKATFKLTVAVDNSGSGANVYIYIDDVQKATYSLSGDDYDVKANSYMAMWAQKVTATIDNLKVSSFTETPSTTAPVAATSFYSNSFEYSDYGIKKTPGYNYSSLKINGAKLISNGGAWKSHSCTIANGATYSDCYVFEAQMDLTTIGTTSLVFNNSGDSTTAAGFHANSFTVRFEWSNDTGYGFFVRKYDDAGNQISTNIVDADALTSTFPGLNYQNFKLTVIVDSTHDEGCLVTVLTNDQYMTSFALDGNYDVKADNAIELWTQGTTNIGFSNIAVKNYLQVNN